MHAENAGGRSAVAWIWAAALVPYGLFVARFDRLTDDAFIYFRFARHLARGYGLSFNPGVDPPVEGFSGLLWVLALALVDRLGGDMLVWSRVLSIACGVILLWLLARTLLSGLGLSLAGAAAGVIWVAILPPFTAWSTGGLETMAFVLLVFLCYQQLLARREAGGGIAAGLAGLAAILLRFDGLGFVAAVLLVAGVMAWRAGDRGLRSETVRALVVVVAGVALLEVWRWSYFGQLLPNTAYAKLGFGPRILVRGAHYLGRAASALPVVVLILCAALALSKRIASRATLGAAALVAATAAHVLLVGGDFMNMFRFLVPAVPFLGVLLAACVDVCWSAGARARSRAVALVGLSLAGALMPAFGLEPGRLFTRRVLAGGEGGASPESQADLLLGGSSSLERWSELGRLLERHAAAGSSLVRSAIGAVGFYSEVTIFDQYGLTDRELARTPAERVPSRAAHIGGHDKFGDLAFFEPRRPTYAYAAFQLRADLERPNSALVRRVFGPSTDEIFLTIYRPVLIPAPAPGEPDRYLLLAERDPDPDGSDHGWREALLRPENLRPAEPESR